MNPTAFCHLGSSWITQCTNTLASDSTFAFGGRHFQSACYRLIYRWKAILGTPVRTCGSHQSNPHIYLGTIGNLR